MYRHEEFNSRLYFILCIYLFMFANAPKNRRNVSRSDTTTRPSYCARIYVPLRRMNEMSYTGYGNMASYVPICTASWPQFITSVDDQDGEPLALLAACLHAIMTAVSLKSFCFLSLLWKARGVRRPCGGAGNLPTALSQCALRHT